MNNKDKTYTEEEILKAFDETIASTDTLKEFRYNVLKALKNQSSHLTQNPCVCKVSTQGQNGCVADEDIKIQSPIVSKERGVPLTMEQLAHVSEDTEGRQDTTPERAKDVTNAVPSEICEFPKGCGKSDFVETGGFEWMHCGQQIVPYYCDECSEKITPRNGEVGP